MEPRLPPDGERKLEDLGIDLATKSSRLANLLAVLVRQGVADLVRSMNCYYSILIEGHDTRPRDFERALRKLIIQMILNKEPYNMKLSHILRFNNLSILRKIYRKKPYPLNIPCGYIVNFANDLQINYFR